MPNLHEGCNKAVGIGRDVAYILRSSNRPICEVLKIL